MSATSVRERHRSIASGVEGADPQPASISLAHPLPEKTRGRNRLPVRIAVAFDAVLVLTAVTSGSGPPVTSIDLAEALDPLDERPKRFSASLLSPVAVTEAFGVMRVLTPEERAGPG